MGDDRGGWCVSRFASQPYTIDAEAIQGRLFDNNLAV
jgi:hypothetical protein